MTLQLLGQFIITYVTVIAWFQYPLLMEPTNIKIYAMDETMDHVIVKVPEMTFSRAISEYDQDISGIQVEQIRQILKDDHGLCFSKDSEDAAWVDITFKRWHENDPLTYNSTASGLHHYEATGGWPDRDFITINKGISPQPYGSIMGTLPFELPIETFPCPVEA